MSTNTITSMRVNINNAGYELITGLNVSNLYPQHQTSKVQFETKQELIDWLEIVIKEVGNNRTSSTLIKQGPEYIRKLIDKLEALNDN